MNKKWLEIGTGSRNWGLVEQNLGPLCDAVNSALSVFFSQVCCDMLLYDGSWCVFVFITTNWTCSVSYRKLEEDDGGLFYCITAGTYVQNHESYFLPFWQCIKCFIAFPFLVIDFL
ncbi:unnamed protein product [Lathyrus sativus]|nr:unnamed protein product [Lathyrus sativus]